MDFKRHIFFDRKHGEEFISRQARFGSWRLPDRWRAVVLLDDSSPGRVYWDHNLPDLVQRWTEYSKQRCVKCSAGSAVFIRAVADAAGPGLEMVCKQGRVDTLIQNLGTVLKGPKEWREFWTGHQLLSAGLATPRPLVCMWRRSGLGIQGRIITEYLQDTLPMDRAIRRLWARGPAPDCRLFETLIDNTVALAYRLGSCGYYHRDLKVGNLLVSDLEHNPRPWLIDLDGVHRDHAPFGSGFDRSLVRLLASVSESTTLSRTAWLRILQKYIARRALAPQQWKAMWMKLQSQVQSRLAKRGPGLG